MNTKPISFLKELFEAQKYAKKTKTKNLVDISDKFTSEEYKHIVGDNYEKISGYAEKYGIPFRAEVLVNQLNPNVHNAILNMGSKSVYVDMLKTSPREMNKIVTDLVAHPYKI